MQRVIVALCVIMSFNVIAIQLFMAGHMGPLNDILSAQQALMVSAMGVVIIDIFLIHLMMITGTGGSRKEKFDAFFRKHFDGHNFDEAFEKAREEYKKLL